MSCDLTIRFKPRDVAARSQAAPDNHRAIMCGALGRAHIEQGSDVVAARPDEIQRQRSPGSGQAAALEATVGRSIHFGCKK